MADAFPAAWYPDPTGRHEFRWYDGQAYTDNVADHDPGGHPLLAFDSLAAPPPASSPEPVAALATSPRAPALRPWYSLKRVWVGAAVVGLLVVLPRVTGDDVPLAESAAPQAARTRATNPNRPPAVGQSSTTTTTEGQGTAAPATASAQASARAGTSATGDVQISSCTPNEQADDPVATVTVTNGSEETSDYHVEVALMDDAGERAGIATAALTGLGPGQQASQPVYRSWSEQPWSTCQVLTVNRTKA